MGGGGRGGEEQLVFTRYNSVVSEQFTANPIRPNKPFRSIAFHCISLHFIAFRCISLDFIGFHWISVHFPSVT